MTDRTPPAFAERVQLRATLDDLDCVLDAVRLGVTGGDLDEPPTGEQLGFAVFVDVDQATVAQLADHANTTSGVIGVGWASIHALKASITSPTS